MTDRVSMPVLPNLSASRCSHFADRETAQKALDMALKMIEPLMSDPQICGSGFLYIVVMSPGTDAETCSFEEAILLEHAIGNPADWDADYASFARAKAKLSWRTGMDGCVVQATRPHLLKEGETLLTGGICLDGIAVGVSGAHPWYDEAFATAIAANLRAMCKAAHAELLQAHCTHAPLAKAGEPSESVRQKSLYA